jgi:pyridoxine/pyridoxamine 5'-phosphate oxidase
MDESSPNYQKIMGYIDRLHAAVISTVNPDGTPHSAVVYLIAASHHTVCFATRNQTQKYKNLLERPTVSPTMFDEKASSTMQATGRAYVVDDDHMLN